MRESAAAAAYRIVRRIEEIIWALQYVLFAVLPVLQAEETEQSTGLLVDVAT